MGIDLNGGQFSKSDDDSGNAPLVTGQRKERLPLWVNRDWEPTNDQPLLEDRERGVAYWFGVEDVQKLVEFVKSKS
jgi:hypothetical protein